MIGEDGSGDGEFMRGIIKQLQEPSPKQEPHDNVHVVESTSFESEIVETVNNTLLITTLERVEHVTINETDQVSHLTL